MNQPNWQRRRSEFNHQWLKNRLLSALDSATNLMRGRITGAGYLEDILNQEIREWPVRRGELDSLLVDFETEMSPRTLFDAPPLAEWESGIKRVMSELLHEFWLVRYPVRTWIGNAQKAALTVDKSYEQLLRVQPIGMDGHVDFEFSARFDAFCTACRELAKTIEKFPSHIQVI